MGEKKTIDNFMCITWPLNDLSWRENLCAIFCWWCTLTIHLRSMNTSEWSVMFTIYLHFIKYRHTRSNIGWIDRLQSGSADLFLPHWSQICCVSVFHTESSAGSWGTSVGRSTEAESLVAPSAPPGYWVFARGLSPYTHCHFLQSPPVLFLPPRTRTSSAPCPAPPAAADTLPGRLSLTEGRCMFRPPADRRRQITPQQRSYSARWWKADVLLTSFCRGTRHFNTNSAQDEELCHGFKPHGFNFMTSENHNNHVSALMFVICMLLQTCSTLIFKLLNFTFSYSFKLSTIYFK